MPTISDKYGIHIHVHSRTLREFLLKKRMTIEDNTQQKYLTQYLTDTIS